MILPEYEDEMFRFVDLSTLDERMKHTQILSKHYQSSLFFRTESLGAPTWNQCSFIEGDRDATGGLAHVLFTTQFVNEAMGCKEKR